MPSQTDTGPRLQLIGFAEDAARRIKPLSASLSAKWSNRQLQFQRGIIEDGDTAKWLEIHADYWQDKDQDYASYVRKLSSTYKAVVDI